MVLIPHTNFIVDGFKHSNTHTQREYVYFLTHMHQDHFTGLKAGWNKGPIYCSPQTFLLLQHKFPSIQNLRILNLNEGTTVRNFNQQEILVTFVDANHCPGSVMILFQGSFGNVLHTGDFRYFPEILHPDCFFSDGSFVQIDHLFIDNTFCAPKFRFPAQQKCYQDIVKIILQHEDSNIWLSLSVFGKEKLLIDLALRFNTKVIVKPEELRVMQILGLRMDVFSTESEDGWIKVVQREKTKELFSQIAQSGPIVCIKLSGFACQTSKVNQHMYVVPYSCHSSYPELVQFIDIVQPRKVTFLCPYSHKVKGNFVIVERIYQDYLPKPEKWIPQKARKRKDDHGKSTYKKVKRPRNFGSKIA